MTRDAKPRCGSLKKGESPIGEVYDAFQSSNTDRWYKALDGKPSDLRALAIHLKKGGQYILLDNWYRTVHPDTIGAQVREAGDAAMLRTLRDGEHIDNAATAAGRILRLCLEMALDTFRPGELEAFQKKAAREIIPLFAALGPTEVRNPPGGD